MTDVTLKKPQVFGIPLPAGLTPYTLSFIALLVISWLVFRSYNVAGLRFDPDALANLGSVVAPLVLISAFIERAVEVVLTPLRGDRSAEMQAQIAILKDQNQPADALERELQAYKMDSRRYAFFIAVTLGIAAGLLGFRGLEGLLDKSVADRIDTTFRFFDIVLTGVVIGGGADGIHKPIQAFTDYMEKISKAAKANP